MGVGNLNEIAKNYVTIIEICFFKLDKNRCTISIRHNVNAVNVVNRLAYFIDEKT